jgi:hypothetical protein
MRAIKTAAPELKKALAAEATAVAGAEKTHAEFAPQRASVERHVGFAEAILQRREQDGSAKRGLDELAANRLKGDPGFRDGDPYWKGFSLQEQQMIDRAAQRLSKQREQGVTLARDREEGQAKKERDQSRGYDFDR